MNSYQNGPIPPFQNNQPGGPALYTPPTRHPGSGFATASLILGIVSILTAFVGTVYPPVICAGLSVLLALLSRGGDRVLLPNAKVGVITAVLGLVVDIMVVVSAFVLIFSNPDANRQFHDQLNRYYEQLYGESFDDALEEIREGFTNGLGGQ